MDGIGSAMINAGGAIAGVLVGAVGTAYVATRATTRNQARVAARVAVDDLQAMLGAIARLRAMESRWREAQVEDYHPRLAMGLNSLHDHLTVRWWDEHRDALVVAADDAERRALSQVVRDTRFVIGALREIGDAGKRQLENRARLKIERERDQLGQEHSARRQAALGSDDSGLVLMEQTSETAVIALDPETAAIVARLDATEAATDQMIAQAAALGDDVGDIIATFEVQVEMAGDHLRSVIALETSLKAALSICDRIAEANRSALGLSIRRPGKRA